MDFLLVTYKNVVPILDVSNPLAPRHIELIPVNAEDVQEYESLSTFSYKNLSKAGSSAINS